MSRDGGLRPLFAQKMPTLHWVNVEVAGLGRGVPDAEYCAPPTPHPDAFSASGWVEYKETPARAVELRPEQVAWMVRRTRAGGRVTVAVRRRHAGGPRKGPPVDELWLLDGAHAATARAKGLVAGAPYVLGQWGGGPRAWDWGAVEQTLRRT